LGSSPSNPSSEAERTAIEARGTTLEAVAPLPGTRIGRYWLTQLVGSGGMGRVYAAYDPQLERVVALKLLRKVGSGAAEHRARLQREAQALARLSHPNVVPVFDVGASHPWLFITMELVEGPDLMRWLGAGRRHWREVLEVFLGAGRGLAAAHEAGLVHRDFKPGNVVVDAEGRARVLDFGLVRMDDSVEASRTRSTAERGLPEGVLADDLTAQGTVVGTPLYMAPEQHRGRPADTRSDQFSFCLSLYEGLYGRRPFVGFGTALLEHKEREPLPPPKDHEVPALLWPILRRGLSVDPRDRWPSMSALLDAISSATTDSRSHRRRIAMITILVATSCAALVWALRGPSTTRCDPSATQLARVWSPQRSATLDDVMRASGVPYATATSASVRGALDDFAADWTASYVDACKSTTDTTTLDWRMECLRDQLEAADALVTVLSDDTAEALEHAAFATAQLPSPDDCADLGGALPQSDPALRSQLASARALGHAGRHLDALAAARDVESAARAAGDRGLELEAALIVARSTQTLGDREDAGQRLRDVTWAAVAAGRDDIVANAAVSMAFLLIADNMLDDAETWLRHAETSLRRAPPDLVTQARLLQAQGSLLTHRGRLDEGLARHTEAASMLADSSAADDLSAMDAVAEIASIQSRLGRLDEAADNLERIIAAYETRLGQGHPATAKPVGKLAGVRYAQRRFEEALALTRRALAIDEQVYPENHRQLTTRRSHLALLLHELKQHEEALLLAKQVHEARVRDRGPDHPEVAQALYNVGHVLYGSGNKDEAVSWFEQALAVWETVSGASHLDLAYPLASLGEARLELGRADEAVEPLERALEQLDGVAESSLRTSVLALLAQAMWDAGDDRERALTLAAQAHRGLVAQGDAGADYRRALERWYVRIGKQPPAQEPETPSIIVIE
jgi:eukaryotic-like serine/threonine-protein kinase